MSQYPNTLQQQTAKKGSDVKWEFPLEKKDLICIAISIAIIVVGYLLMSTGMSEEAAVPDGTWNNFWAVNVAPVILIIGYCVVLPYGILKRFDKPATTDKAE